MKFKRNENGEHKNKKADSLCNEDPYCKLQFVNKNKNKLKNEKTKKYNAAGTFFRQLTSNAAIGDNQREAETTSIPIQLSRPVVSATLVNWHINKTIFTAA